MFKFLALLGLVTLPRHYALIDAHGLCAAFRTCGHAPAGSGWVEVTETRLHSLGRPLPASARVSRPAVASELMAALQN
ncbi:hypothetical protein [Pseudomonas sp. KNUC1026]|uniref:hypothetical protein n=1 Tax=Pseudomonas sp. KNUC1026 TaxID=2893890 RepID=UPI001F19BC98|nr:hypothetical protein [Pseudomonas sp. KNUC1026]UFH48651.1 hypothetical protein LN139_16615 [Pseudomonas sp. KNUC1026]